MQQIKALLKNTIQKYLLSTPPFNHSLFSLYPLTEKSTITIPAKINSVKNTCNANHSVASTISPLPTPFIIFVPYEQEAFAIDWI
jgi:hypothetical protein